MSFAGECKTELSLAPAEKDCCRAAELCGLYCACGTLSLLGLSRFNVQFVSQSMAVSRRVFTLLRREWGITPQIHYVTHARFGGSRSCVITLGPVHSPRLLVAFGMAVSHGDHVTYRTASPRLPLTRTCCKKAFLRGLFLGGGTVSAPQKGYHLELRVNGGTVRDMAARALLKLELPVHVADRKSGSCFYLKQCDQILLLLRAMGAGRSAAEMEEARIRKQVYTTTVRAVNCDEANLKKQLSASHRQVERIEQLLHSEVSLTPALRDMAVIRLQNPAASLEELAALHNPPISKSAVNHRLRRLEELWNERFDAGGSGK